jgi:hypothetical protein
MPARPDDALLTTAEAAAITGLSEKFFAHDRQGKRLFRYIKISNRVRYHPDWLREDLAKMTRGSAVASPPKRRRAA